MHERSQLLPLRLLPFVRLAAIFSLISAATLHAAPVLMISIDGLKPEYVTLLPNMD